MASLLHQNVVGLAAYGRMLLLGFTNMIQAGWVGRLAYSSEVLGRSLD
jgi:hypothetical protein